MLRQNIFNGDSYFAQFVTKTYNRLMTHKWTTYADIMADYLNLKSAKELPCNVSDCDNYGELKKAFSELRKIINEKHGTDCFEIDGNNRKKKFRYIGEDDDPLAEMRIANTITSLKKYWQFCQDSSGFFPTSWLEYFFKDCQDLLDIKKKKQKGEEVLSSSLDRMLKNIDLLPFLYEAIIHKQVLEIDYKPYEKETEKLIFHPQYIREYNGRWQLFGHAEGMEPEWAFDVALDRIEGRPRELYKVEYKKAPAGFYTTYFKDLVGVSHYSKSKPNDIRIRAHGLRMFKLTETKPVHHSQKLVLPYGEYEDGSYGEFEVHVEVNNEFIGRILQMGAGLEIVSPPRVRKIFAKRVDDIQQLYNK